MKRHNYIDEALIADLTAMVIANIQDTTPPDKPHRQWKYPEDFDAHFRHAMWVKLRNIYLEEGALE